METQISSTTSGPTPNMAAISGWNVPTPPNLSAILQWDVSATTCNSPTHACTPVTFTVTLWGDMNNHRQKRVKR